MGVLVGQLLEAIGSLGAKPSAVKCKGNFLQFLNKNNAFLCFDQNCN